MKISYLNMRIPKELSNGLDEMVKDSKTIGVKTSKTFIVEKYLFKILSERGYLSKQFIRTGKEKYEK